MLAPWGAVAGTAVYLAADHHESEAHHHDAETPNHDADAHDPFEGGVLHGHRHSADTPDHDHGLSLPGVVHQESRPPVVAALATWRHFALSSASLSFVPAPAVSPPRLAPIVLRT